MSLQFTAASSMRVYLGTDINVLKNVAGCTLMAWVNPTTITAGAAIISVAVGPPPGTSASSRANMEMNASGGLFCGFRASDTESVKSITVASQFSAGVWGHYAVTCNYGGTSGNLIGYKNGVQVGTASATFAQSTTANTNSKNAAMGSGDDGTAPFWDGIIEDARVYDHVLTPAEIRAIFEIRGPDMLRQGLQLQYFMREFSAGTVASGTGTVKDFGSVNRHGDPVNSPVYRECDIRDYADPAL
jgi:hypothetical protein